MNISGPCHLFLPIIYSPPSATIYCGGIKVGALVAGRHSSPMASCLLPPICRDIPGICDILQKVGALLGFAVNAPTSEPLILSALTSLRGTVPSFEHLLVKMKSSLQYLDLLAAPTPESLRIILKGDNSNVKQRLVVGVASGLLSIDQNG
ncbi:hypothetical protein GDO78_015105 [Eleutherodactylus coqui]|uniref:Uncharacterized protein n=1 Tax=Eleutherodactylus coqui TaxID=57060 RepID=A0A8J6EL25_ELECQ|nr:hypothetical protein GDO78_015105 [Eleutherodactylus coqui]